MSLAAFDFLRALAAGWLYRIRAERRLGEILADAKASGAMREGRPETVATDDSFTLERAGISRDLSSRAQAIASVPEDAPTAPRTGWRVRALLPCKLAHPAPFRAVLAGRGAVARWQADDGPRLALVWPYMDGGDFALLWTLHEGTRTASTIGRPLHVDALDLGLRALAPDLPPGMTWETVAAADAEAHIAAALAECEP